MAVVYKKVIFPGVGVTAGKALKKVKDWDREFNDAIVDYLKTKGITDSQGIVLPGGIAARNMIAKARKDAGVNPLVVRAGLTSAGALVMSISGMLPAKKQGGDPITYDESTVVRKDFATFVTNKKSETNMVVNLTKKKNSSKGDSDINESVDLARGKWGVNQPQTLESLDLGGLTTGTVILTAHGDAVAFSGTVLGTEFGRRTPPQIVEVLIKNPDKKRRLSKKFAGTVLLSGCFTASGSGKTYNANFMPGYNYSTFAGAVLDLLRKKGYSKLNVQGLPGPGVTEEEDDPGGKWKKGDENTRHGMRDDVGAEALLQQIAMIEERIEEVKLRHNGKKLAILKDKEFKRLSEQFARLQEEHKEVINSQDEVGREANRIANLVGTFGLKKQ